MIEVINNLTLIFVTASITLLLFDRIDHPSIPSYILAGIIVGPLVELITGVSLISQENILVLAQIGIAFLVFILGTDMETSKFQRLVKGNISLTILKTGLIGLPVFLIAYFTFFDIFNSIYIALAASLSSSLISIELLDSKVRNIIHHRLTYSINLIQDLLAISIFIIIASEPLSLPIVGMNLIIGVTIMLVALTMKKLIPLLIEYLGKTREMYILISASTLLVFSVFSEVLGLTIVVGAFAAGLALSKKPYNQEVVQTIGSLKDFFSAIFFVSLGALVVLPTKNVLILSLVLTAIIVFVKPLIGAYFLQKSFDKRTSYMTSLNLDQVSEYVLIIAIQAFIANTIVPVVFQAIILTATVTMITSSYTSRHSEKIYDFMKKHKWLKVAEKDFVDKNFSEKIKGHFIIGGYDIQGKEITKMLRREGQKVVVIENNPEKILDAQTNGLSYIYGDMMVEDVWESAYFKDAKMIISTVPLEKVSEKVLELDTDADKIIRAKNMIQVKKYIEKCIYVIYPHFLATKKLIEHLRGSLESEDYRKRLRDITRREIS